MGTTKHKYFTIEELCQSATADKYGIANKPSAAIEKNLHLLIENILDPLREAYGGPIHVNSGYRCEALNAKVGGSKTSEHMYGRAADIKVYKTEGGKKVNDKNGNQRLFELCISLGLPFRQLIDEYGFSWVHVSFNPSASNQHQVKHLK